MDRARDELLAGAALALDQNGRSAGRRLDDQVEHLPHPWTAPDDVRELVVPLLDVLPERPVLSDQAALLHGVACDDRHLFVLEWLRDVVERSALHRRDRALDRAVRRDDNDREILVDPLQLVERRDAVETGHHDVDDRGVERQRACEVEPLGTRRSGTHFIALAGEQRLENLAHNLFVVDDEDCAVAGWSHDKSQAEEFSLLQFAALLTTGVAGGKVSVNRVPRPTALSQRIEPSCSCTIP